MRRSSSCDMGTIVIAPREELSKRSFSKSSHCRPRRTCLPDAAPAAARRGQDGLLDEPTPAYRREQQRADDDLDRYDGPEASRSARKRQTADVHAVKLADHEEWQYERRDRGKDLGGAAHA